MHTKYLKVMYVSFYNWTGIRSNTLYVRSQPDINSPDIGTITVGQIAYMDVTSPLVRSGEFTYRRVKFFDGTRWKKGYAAQIVYDIVKGNSGEELIKPLFLLQPVFEFDTCQWSMTLVQLEDI